MFIAFEGLDGSGGTTQIGLYEVALQAAGHTVVRTREPSDGPVGALIGPVILAFVRALLTIYEEGYLVPDAPEVGPTAP